MMMMLPCCCPAIRALATTTTAVVVASPKVLVASPRAAVAPMTTTMLPVLSAALRKVRNQHRNPTATACQYNEPPRYGARRRLTSTATATPPRRRPNASTSSCKLDLASVREGARTTKDYHDDNKKISREVGDDGQAQVRVLPDGSAIEVAFGRDGKGGYHDNDHGSDLSMFHASWLWLYQPQFVHPSSGQRTASPSTAQGWSICRASIGPGEDASHPIPPPPGCLHPVGSVYQGPPGRRPGRREQWVRLEWKHDRRDEFHYTQHSLSWLAMCRYDRVSVQRLDYETSQYDANRTTKTTTTATTNNNSTITTTLLRRDTVLHEVDYTDLLSNDDACLAILSAVVEQGAALVRNAPEGHVRDDGGDDDSKTVAQVAVRLAGGLSHGQLYGNTFHVQNMLKAQNIAYTSAPLPPHQDLVYYQSPPGLQLLHCVENSVRGGESTLIDALAAATQLHEWRPDLFDALTQCCATFVKQREAADMVYRAPHIQAIPDAAGTTPVVVAVRWAPPFQGPLLLEPPQLQRYWAAYLALERMLDNSLPQDLHLAASPHGVSAELEECLRDYAHRHTWEQRLEPGDVLVFNNLRLLHGRRGFHLDAGGGHRHLIGCYTNMDDTLNRYRLIWRQKRPSSAEGTDVRYQRVSGNGSAGVLL